MIEIEPQISSVEATAIPTEPQPLSKYSIEYFIAKSPSSLKWLDSRLFLFQFAI